MKHNYHEQGNIIIILLLLPLGHISNIRCFGDSDLVAQQVSGKWDSKDPLMATYHREVDAIARHSAPDSLDQNVVCAL